MFLGSLFHCGFTGARLWNRSAFLMGLRKGISFLTESLYKYIWRRYAMSIYSIYSPALLRTYRIVRNGNFGNVSAKNLCVSSGLAEPLTLVCMWGEPRLYFTRTLSDYSVLWFVYAHSLVDFVRIMYKSIPLRIFSTGLPDHLTRCFSWSGAVSTGIWPADHR